LYEFLWDLTADGATNRGGESKIGNFSLKAASLLIYLEMCGRLPVSNIYKAYYINGFLMTEKQDT